MKRWNDLVKRRTVCERWRRIVCKHQMILKMYSTYYFFSRSFAQPLSLYLAVGLSWLSRGRTCARVLCLFISYLLFFSCRFYSYFKWSEAVRARGSTARNDLSALLSDGIARLFCDICADFSYISFSIILSIQALSGVIACACECVYHVCCTRATAGCLSCWLCWCVCRRSERNCNLFE